MESDAGSSPRVRFNAADPFQRKLRARVDRYLRMTGLKDRDSGRMYVKTAVVFAWVIASYILIMFFATTWWMAVPLAISLGLGTAAIGFNVQHDGSHGAYSNHRWVNRLMARTLDLVGASSFIWARKHNSIHHTFTNIDGWDEDINVGFLGRLSPEQKHLPVHRLQHVYLWFLYAFLPMKWQIVDDFKDVARGRIGQHRIPRPTGWELVIFILGKATFFSYAIVIPALYHPLWAVLSLYAVACFAQGIVLSIVFQLAHVVEEANFPEPDEASGLMSTSWAVHQILTTVDFARKNRLLSWYVGGLNFQVEHHLFPRICHIHYPKISRLVEHACKRAGIPYRANVSFLSAIRSHYRWVKEMGKPEPALAT